MNKPIKLSARLTRSVSHYKRFDIEVPKELLDKRAVKPDLRDFPYPLPQKKSDYICFDEGADGVIWYGSNGGVTRYCPDADRTEDIIMYFSADRDLLDNNVRALIAQGDGVWVLTETGVTHIDMLYVSGEQKADILRKETLSYVARHDMVSQRDLAEPRNLKSRRPFGHSDNDGCFTAGFAIGEIFRYATLKKELGAYDKETLKAREIALKASEATLLLMYISGRGDGFVARTYVTSAEPVPDDGLFYKKNGAKAVCINTTSSRKKNIVGFEVKADAPIPDRLAKHYRDEGFSDTDITYKGDTSSDEITLHYLHILIAHEFLGREDIEYDALLSTAAKNTLAHIINNGYRLCECDGKPTTWAKWDMEYFTTGLGWSDGCLNCAQLLMYLRVVMHITGEEGVWKENYDKLVALGYADLPLKHRDRFLQTCMAAKIDEREDIMYGDHMLAVATYWGLLTLEPEGKNKENFKQAFKDWRSSIMPEHNPGYDFPFLLCCPEEEKGYNWDMAARWFSRFNISQLAAGISLDKRLDIPKKILWGGYKETSYLLMPDERFISKYDRNPFEYKNEDSGGKFCVESCYVYTFAYWIGRFFGYIDSDE